MKNKIFSVILLALLSLPVCVWAVDENATVEELVATQEQVQTINTLDDEIEAVGEDSEFKEPISKRKLAKKFLAAMGGVAISSFLLFFLLTLYNRVRENVKNKVKTPEGETSLETPNDLSSAVKTFLEKTKWE